MRGAIIGGLIGFSLPYLSVSMVLFWIMLEAVKETLELSPAVTLVVTSLMFGVAGVLIGAGVDRWI